MSLTVEQDAFLRRRIQQLKSRQQSAGPFRAAGIQRTLEGMRKQLRDGIWQPHTKDTHHAR